MCLKNFVFPSPSIVYDVTKPMHETAILDASIFERTTVLMQVLIYFLEKNNMSYRKEKLKEGKMTGNLHTKLY